MLRLRYGWNQFFYKKRNMHDWVHVDFVILTTSTDIMRTMVHG